MEFIEGFRKGDVTDVNNPGPVFNVPVGKNIYILCQNNTEKIILSETYLTSDIVVIDCPPDRPKDKPVQVILGKPTTDHTYYLNWGMVFIIYTTKYDKFRHIFEGRLYKTQEHSNYTPKNINVKK